VDVLIIVELVVGPDSVSIDSQRFLLAVVEKESHGHFVTGFRWDDISMIAGTIYEREY
jgi:uncharacterized protein YkuJ